ncbi:MAG: hypothetical protein D6730_01075 [Bacteroidetes bacterium]|nr:MAG: hypothetical protein D6730_01075 [Bacteroidota bacterium]
MNCCNSLIYLPPLELGPLCVYVRLLAGKKTPTPSYIRAGELLNLQLHIRLKPGYPHLLTPPSGFVLYATPFLCPVNDQHQPLDSQHICLPAHALHTGCACMKLTVKARQKLAVFYDLYTLCQPDRWICLRL